MMHQKLDAREYRTWRSFIDDFVLICNNALTYNQKRSRVHRAALQLMRQGKKLLSDHELVARRALTMVHPDGPAQATLEEQQDLLTNGLALVPSSPLAAETPTSDGPQRAMSLHALNNSAADTQGVSHNTEELVFGYASSEDGAAYSSFSDTDMSGDEDEQAAPPPLPPRANTTLVHDSNGLFAAPPARGPKRSSSWKAAHRDVERRCRWLELRLRGLHTAAEACRAGLDKSDDDDERVLMQVDGAATPSEPSPPTTARRRSARNHQAAAPRKASHRAVRSVAKELSTATDVPFVAAHLQLRKHAPIDVQALHDEPDACLPARVYAALELVERQIATVRKHLHTTAHHHSLDDRKRSGMRGGRGSRGLGRPAGGRGRGWQGRSDSFGNKRRRLEYGVHEMVATHKLMAPKFVEKAQVAPIATPGFRTLPENELKQRTAAVAALSKRQQLPSEVAKALAEESSSDEDTSDEAYEQRHHQREQEEKDWYAQYTGTWFCVLCWSSDMHGTHVVSAQLATCRKTSRTKTASAALRPRCPSRRGMGPAAAARLRRQPTRRRTLQPLLRGGQRLGPRGARAAAHRSKMCRRRRWPRRTSAGAAVASQGAQRPPMGVRAPHAVEGKSSSAQGGVHRDRLDE